MMNHITVYFPAAHAECPQTKVGRKMRSLRVAARHAAATATPGQQKPASGSFEAFGAS